MDDRGMPERLATGTADLRSSGPVQPEDGDLVVTQYLHLPMFAVLDDDNNADYAHLLPASKIGYRQRTDVIWYERWRYMNGQGTIADHVHSFIPDLTVRRNESLPRDDMMSNNVRKTTDALSRWQNVIRDGFAADERSRLTLPLNLAAGLTNHFFTSELIKYRDAPDVGLCTVWQNWDDTGVMGDTMRSNAEPGLVIQSYGITTGNGTVRPSPGIRKVLKTKEYNLLLNEYYPRMICYQDGSVEFACATINGTDMYHTAVRERIVETVRVFLHGRSPGKAMSRGHMLASRAVESAKERILVAKEYSDIWKDAAEAEARRNFMVKVDKVVDPNPLRAGI